MPARKTTSYFGRRAGDRRAARAEDRVQVRLLVSSVVSAFRRTVHGPAEAGHYKKNDRGPASGNRVPALFVDSAGTWLRRGASSSFSTRRQARPRWSTKSPGRGCSPCNSDTRSPRPAPCSPRSWAVSRSARGSPAGAGSASSARLRASSSSSSPSIALLLPLALAASVPLLAWAYADGMAPARFAIVRVAISLLLVGIPAAAMGATFPIAAGWFAAGAREASAAARLYAANTAGAASGAIAAGFFLIPAIGLRGTTWVGVALNVVAAAGAWWLAASTTVNAEHAETARTDPFQRTAGQELRSASDRALTTAERAEKSSSRKQHKSLCVLSEFCVQRRQCRRRRCSLARRLRSPASPR